MQAELICMKGEIGVFVQAVVFLVIGLYLSSQGVPADREEAALQAGDKIVGSLNSSTSSSAVSSITLNGKSALAIIGNGLTVVAIIELLILGIIVVLKGISFL